MSDQQSRPTAPGGRGARGFDLTTGSIPRHLIVFSIPMLIGSMLQVAYSIVNAAWVGRGLGTDAMAAVTVSFPVFFVLMSVALGLTMATSILVSQSYGAKDLTRMRQVIQSGVSLTLALGIIVTVLGILFARHLLTLMQTDLHVLPVAAGYLKLFNLTLPLMFVAFLVGSVLRGVGDSKTPLYFQAGSVVLTAVLDPVLMFGWLGFPKYGLNGTAYATIIAQSAGLLSLIYYLHKKQHIASPDWLHPRIDMATSLMTLKIGIPTMFQQVFVSMGMVVIVGIVNKFGTDATAAYGTASRIDQLAFMPAMTMGVAVSTIAGQNIGAKLFHRVRQTMKWGLIISGAMAGCAALIAFTIPQFLIGLFLKDPVPVSIGANYLRIVAVSYLFLSVMFVSNGVINGAGHTLATTLFTLVSLWVFRVPLAEIMSRRSGRIESVWWAILISFAVGMIMSLAYYFSGRWKIPIKQKTAIEPVVVKNEVDNV